MLSCNVKALRDLWIFFRNQSTKDTLVGIFKLVMVAQLTFISPSEVEGVNLVIWSGVEINVAIICTSLPALKLLARRAFSRYDSLTGSFEMVPRRPLTL